MTAEMTLQVVVSPFLGVLFDNLSSLIKKEVGLIWGVHKEMNKLASTLSTIQAVLEDAEEKQLTNRAVANWLSKLRELAYDAYDILDEWAVEASSLPLGPKQVTYSKQVCASIFTCFCFEQISVRHRIARRVKELRNRFDEIASERSAFHLREGVVERRLEHYPNRETSSLPNDPHVYGRDEEREYVVQLLLNNVYNQEVSVCPIVGIGGLGKTTLAQVCYNDPRVEQHFDVRIWVCVSDDFDVNTLTKAIVVSISGEVCTIKELDPLQRLLQEKLDHRRFLLVLDDVWNENQEEWSRFKNSLRSRATGSSIMVTTRLRTVASITGTCSPCNLKLLSENDCWLLFKQRAFGTENEVSPNLVGIGREIVKRCGGVPLAAKVLGGLMRFKREEREWLVVRDSRIWDLPQSSGNTILPALKLSYTHLAPELRQCFAYCSIYPKGHKIKKEELIRLWMANGLIQHKEGMQLEDVGYEIFKELSWRSFFEEEEEEIMSYRNSPPVRYKMHELLHDLACSINVNESFHLDGANQTTVPNDTRHLFLRLETSPLSILHSLHQSGRRLCTLIMLRHSYDDIFSDDINLSYFSSLRALSLNQEKSWGRGSELSPRLIESIVQLKHLRYLNLSRSRIVFLSESLSNLRNLQTLELEDCRNLKKLPKCMRDINSLRHLNIKGCNLSEMPIDLGKLTSLQTLSFFIVGLDYGRGIEELRGLDCLCGELEIKGVEHVNTIEDARKANLMRKQHLTSLKLYWPGSDLEGGNQRDVIEGLQPHSNVKSLSIHGYNGLTFPSWLNASWLSKLADISITKCTKCENLPSALGVLPLLKRIFMETVESVKYLASDDIANEFPSLECLTISSMPILEDWFSFTGKLTEVVRFPCLKELIINYCPKMRSLPPSSLSLLENLELSECNPMILNSLKNLPCLSYLLINNFTETTDFPEEMLQNVPSLKSLDIVSCLALQSLPEVKNSSLTRMFIQTCPSLTHVAHGLRCQTSLQTLVISGCPIVDISTVEYHHLNSLQSLRIGEIPDMTSLPDGLQHASSTLQNLQVWECPAMISLPDWMGTLTNLEFLDFRRCENLENLPDSIQHLTNLQRLEISRCKNLKSLPDGFQHLTNLQNLRISRCHPELHRRCHKESGEYWPMISHIPIVDNHFSEEDL